MIINVEYQKFVTRRKYEKTTPYNHAIGCVTTTLQFFASIDFWEQNLIWHSTTLHVNKMHITQFYFLPEKLQICFRIVFDFHFIYVVWYTNACLTYQNFLNDYDHIKLLLNINQNRTSIIGITLRFSCVMLQNILSCIPDICIISFNILFVFLDIYFRIIYGQILL